MSYSKSLQDWGEREFPRVKSRRSQRGSGSNYYSNRVLGLSPLAYWPLNELGGTKIVDISGNGYNGTYTAASLGQTGIGDGGTAAGFDGSTSVANIYGAAFAAAFNNQEGTASVWVQNTVAWADATVRYFVCLQVNGNNRVYLRKDGANSIGGLYTAAATNSGVSFNPSNIATFFHFCMTWSKSNDRVKVYFQGTQQGTNQTGLGVWAGALTSTTTCLGSVSSSAPANVWSGKLAHTAIWTRELSAAEVKSIATI